MSPMDDIQRTAEQQLVMLEDVQRRLDALAVRETGDAGRVIVDVDVSGGVTGLQLSPGAGDGRPAALADAIVHTAVRAATEAFAQRAEIMSTFVSDFAELSGASMEPNRGPVRPNFRERSIEGES